MKSRCWCWTLNNYTDEEVQRIRQCTRAGRVRAMGVVFGFEEGEEGTLHLQGYVELRLPWGLSTVKNCIGARIHAEPRHGPPVAAFEYCTKEGNFEMYGEFPFADGVGQGFRTDLDEIRAEIEEGKQDLEIAQAHFSRWVYLRRSFEVYRSLFNRESVVRDFLRVYVLWGIAGTGKTRFVHDYSRTQGEPLWTGVDSELKWFDGYTGQLIVLFDDFRGECNYSLLLRLLDIYPLDVPVKGAFVQWRPGRVFITSNVEPEDWYPNVDWSPLRRRIHKMRYFGRDAGSDVGRDWTIDFEEIRRELEL